MPRAMRGLVGCVLWIAIVVGCEPGARDAGEVGGEESPAARFCEALGDYAAQCAPTACDEALMADCSALTGLVNEPFLSAAASCVREGRPPAECAVESTRALAPTDAHRSFASAFCENCAFGVSGCTELLAGAEGEGDERLRAVRSVVAPLGEPLIAKLEAECTSGRATCAAGFPSCAQRVLVAEALPTETVRCLMDQLLGRAEAPPREAECRIDVAPDRDGGGGTGGDAGIIETDPVRDAGTRDAGGGAWCPADAPYPRRFGESAPRDVCSDEFVACWDSCRGSECDACWDLDPECYSCWYQRVVDASLDLGCASSWELFACCVNVACPEDSSCVNDACAARFEDYQACTRGLPDRVFRDAQDACILGR
ncbi:Hypothetical protein I5071_860 (plasmid) [Sandaracinus amylolyticus]|nr:Hypothetical protein I5071_860 [Sandaracinus amylolyticus]